MTQSLVLARSLHRALKELDEAHAALASAPESPYLNEKVEDAEDHLAQVLENLKQWTIEP